MYNFTKRHNINSFWTFDSDNLIFTNLAKQEYKFEDYDCTEQCCGSCMNGYVSNLNVVKGYLDKINDLFTRDDYLNDWAESCKIHPLHAFTEMAAYAIYKQEENIKTIRLNEIIDGETFDKCLMQGGKMEMYFDKLRKIHFKKLYMAPDGNFYEYSGNPQRMIKMNTINMSWMPIEAYQKLCKHSLLRFKKKEIEVESLNKTELKYLKLSTFRYLFYLIKRKTLKKVNETFLKCSNIFQKRRLKNGNIFFKRANQKKSEEKNS